MRYEGLCHGTGWKYRERIWVEWVKHVTSIHEVEYVNYATVYP